MHGKEKNRGSVRRAWKEEMELRCKTFEYAYFPEASKFLNQQCMPPISPPPMPSSLRESLSAFNAHLLETHGRWRDFEYLYGTAASRETLTRFSSAFFSDLWFTLYDSVLLGIWALYDPNSNDMLTTNYLRALVPREDHLLKDRLDIAQSYLRKCISKGSCGGIHWHRNNRIAHLKRDAVFRDAPEHIVPWTDIQHAFRLLRCFLQQIYLYYDNTYHCSLGNVVRLSLGADHLVRRLNQLESRNT